MFCYQTCVFIFAIVTHDCTVLLLQKYCLKVSVVSVGFWSSYLKFYIHLLCINTQERTTRTFSLWFPSSRVSLLWWYYANTVERFIWYCLVFIQLVIKLISIYPASTHNNEQQHHSTSHISYHIATTKRQDCIRGDPIVARGIVTMV